jgi:predicted ATPase
MHIQSCRLKNYRSFRDSGEIVFTRGFNLVVDSNNVGKTALLTALELQTFGPVPHRDIDIPRGAATDPNSWMSVELVLTGGELRNRVLAANGQFSIPIPDAVVDPETAIRYLDTIFEREEITFRLVWDNGWRPAGEVSYERNLSSSYSRSVIFQTKSDRSQFQTHQFLQRAQSPESLYQQALNFFVSSTYRFRAERLIPARCAIGSTPILNPDGSNLAATLLLLQANRKPYDNLMVHVRSIFPNVQHVSVVPVSSTECEIRVWTFDQNSGRDDLAVSLNESGTGVAQVLAILYIVTAYDQATTIIIDEPNSYLHPGAARNLIQILRATSHQYIISTHSPEIISISEPDSMSLLAWNDGATTISRLDAYQIADTRRILLAVGSKLSDLFGSDFVLWVEGPTEAECFRRVLLHFGKLPLGTSITAVRNTGDFEAKRASGKMVWEVYEKLSAGNALLPTAIAFSFDREGRSEREIEDLIRQSRGRVHFLFRRMFENYLLHPAALASLLNTMEAFGSEPITPERVEEWLSQNAASAKYGASSSWDGNPSNPEWLREVDGANLLKGLVTDLSKIGHGIDLTEWILKNDPDKLRDLAEHLAEIVKPDDAAASA